MCQYCRCCRDAEVEMREAARRKRADDDYYKEGVSSGILAEY